MAIIITRFDHDGKFECNAAAGGELLAESHAAKRAHGKGESDNPSNDAAPPPRGRATWLWHTPFHRETAKDLKQNRLGYRSCPFCQRSNCPNNSSFCCRVNGAPPEACCRSSMKREKIARRSCRLGVLATWTLRCSHCSAAGKRRHPGSSAVMFTSRHFGSCPGSSSD